MPKYDVAINTSRIPIQGLIPEQGTAYPSSPVEGMLFHRTDLKQFFAYLNGVWTRIDTAGASFPPNGAAGGSLNGSYPNPTLSASAVNSPQLNSAIVALSKSYGISQTGTATPTQVALRALGRVDPNDAMPGDTRLDQVNVPTNAVSMNGQRLSSVGDPTASSDAVNKLYVDNLIQGLDVKGSVRLMAAAFVDVNSPPAQIDGITTAVGDRILLNGNNSGNGIYVIQADGKYQRSSDMNTWAQVPGAFVFVEEGNSTADTGWVSTADRGGTIGSTTITWSQFSGIGVVQAGSGIVKSGNTISVLGDEVTIHVGTGSSGLSVVSGGIGPTQLANNAVDLTGTKVTGTLPISRGGTGATSAAGAKGQLGFITKSSSANPAMTAGTYYRFTHNIGEPMVHVSFIEYTTGNSVELDWRTDLTNGNWVEYKADIAISASTFQITVMG